MNGRESLAYVQGNLQLKTSAETEGCFECACAGDVSFSALQAKDEPLAKMLGPDVYRRRVLLDFAKVGFLDSTGVSWLITCQKRFAKDGGIMVLHSMPPLARAVIDLLRLNKILHLQPDIGAARTYALRAKP